MLKFLRIPFGQSGDRAPVPDSPPVGGDVSYTTGYGIDYARPKTDPLSKNIEREKMNQVFFDVTTAVGEIQAQGVPDFITTILNGGSPFSYAENAIVRYAGAVYFSLVGANTSLPTDPTKWLPLPLTAALLPFLQLGTGAVSRSSLEKMRERVTPLDFMTPAQKADVYAGTMLVDVADAFAKASAASLSILVPGFKYRIETPTPIENGQTWLMQGPQFSHTDDTKAFFRANAKADWAILGKCTVIGTLVTAATTTEYGLHITDGKRYRVEGFTARMCKGAGFLLDGASAGALRGDRGQFTDCGAFECTVGRQVDAGAGAEYNSWVNLNISGCVTGDRMAAGNNTTVGGSIVDNTTGVALRNGANHGHGMYVGTNINHNQSANIDAIGVTNGFTFSGCHMYGNGGSTSIIWLNGCSGIQIVGGVIDCPIFNDSGAGSGMNRIEGNYLPVPATVTVQSNNAALSQLSLEGNFTPAGSWSLNDPAAVYVRASRGVSTQSAAGGVAIVFNSEQRDNRNAYDPATGIFTAPVSGWYRVQVNLTISGTALTGGYAEIKGNGATVAYVPLSVVPGATVALGSATVDVNVNVGQTIAVTGTASGTTPLVSITTSWLNIALLG